MVNTAIQEDRAVSRLIPRALPASLLAAIVAAAAPGSSLAQQLSVVVNGQALYLNPGPIEQSGRVLVPMRAIFERLGASVVYSAGTINATKEATTVSLRIGATQATVNGATQTLDVPPFILGATTYVPLRFIAQSLGANVGYDASTRVVSVDVAQAPPPPNQPPPVPPHRPRPPAPPPPNPPPEVRLRAQQPAPGSQTRDRFIVISAEFSRNVEASSVRVWLDGANRTYQSGVSSSGFSYKPPAPLDLGAHTVRVTGRAPGGVAFDRSWSFTIMKAAPEPIRLTINQPAPNSAVGRSFNLQGNTIANGRVRVTAGASPRTTGQFSGSTTAGPRGNFSLYVTLTTMPGQQTVTLEITVTDPVSSRTAQSTLRLRLGQVTTM
jgi:hypothetical protein